MPSGRRFAIVCPNYHPRTCGVGDHSMRLAQELERRGFQVGVFTREPAQPHPEAPNLDLVAERGSTPLVVAERLRRRIATFRATDLILQYTPHMLGAWRWGSPAMPWLALSGRRAGMNVVLLAHELFLPWRLRPDLALGAFLHRGQLAAMMKSSNRVLVTMETRIAEIAQLGSIVRLSPPPGVVRVGTNALPMPRVKVPGRVRLGVFSTLASTKRFDIALEAFAVIQAQYPAAELVLLGDIADSNDRRARDLHAAIAGHPARERIRVPGKLTLVEVAREVAEMDVYLFPMISGANTRSGTLPLALGTGLPVIATSGYETDNVFVGEQNVLFAEALTGRAFAEAALRVLNDPSLAERISAGATRLYQSHLSWEKIGDHLLSQI